MERNEILKQVQDVFREIFTKAEINISENTSPVDVEEWDSLNHIQIVVALEKRFKIKFTSIELQNWRNVGDIINSIQNKIINQ
ncbi:MAG: acyl carrier protein [Ignavibacteria bacterium]